MNEKELKYVEKMKKEYEVKEITKLDKLKTLDKKIKKGFKKAYLNL